MAICSMTSIGFEIPPDQNAFRTFAQKKYLEKYGNDWPKGAIEKINAIK